MTMNDYHRIHQTYPGYQAMPLIGLPNEPAYIEIVSQAGGVPMVIPSGQSVDGLVNILNTLDGILTTGNQETLLTRLAADRQIPILPIDASTDSHAIRTFLSEATSFMEAKRLHNRILTLDSHCDTPMFFDQQINFASRDPKILVDLHKMTEGHLDATIMPTRFISWMTSSPKAFTPRPSSLSRQEPQSWLLPLWQRVMYTIPRLRKRSTFVMSLPIA